MALPHDPDQLQGQRPPPQIDEQAMSDLITGFEAHLPTMLGQFADLLGRTAPRISVQERRRFMERLRRKLRPLWSAFTELEALGAAPESAEKTEKATAVLRSILIEMLATPRIRKSPDVDRLDWLIAMAARATNPPRAAWARQAPYLEARTHLWNVLISVYSQVPLAAVQTVLDAWASDGEHRRYVHSLRLLTVAAARFHAKPTQRSSDRAAVELQNEYLRTANVFEQQLRLLTCLVRAAPGIAKPWSYWQHQSLKNLMEMASVHDELRNLVPFIDRHVRNALTHGPPLVDRSARRCQFWDRDICVTWNWEDYFRNTRALTLAVLGCANLDCFRHLIEIQILARALAPNQPISRTTTKAKGSEQPKTALIRHERPVTTQDCNLHR